MIQSIIFIEKKIICDIRKTLLISVLYNIFTKNIFIINIENFRGLTNNTLRNTGSSMYNSLDIEKS